MTNIIDGKIFLAIDSGTKVVGTALFAAQIDLFPYISGKIKVKALSNLAK